MDQKHVRLSIIGSVILLIGLVGLTYAFFNYTRTGASNTISVGRIAFDTSQGTAINLTNAFPIDVSEGIPNNSNVGSVTINVTGDTTYTNGLEYLVSAVNVTNTVGSGQNAKSLPISIDVGVSSNTENDPATTLGAANDDYFSDRGSTTSYYKVLANDTISTDDQLVVGYIAPGQAGVDGNIVIRAYLDASNIAISDTYDESDPGTANMGTTSEWVGTREVFTTTEWNSLQTNGVSFQVKVESNEGIWVHAPLPTIASCPGCVYKYTTNTLNYGDNGTVLQSSDVSEDYNDVLNGERGDFLGFLGLILENGTSGKILRAFACGVKQGGVNDGTVFCIEGSTDGSTYSANNTLLNDSENGLWRGGCIFDNDENYYYCLTNNNYQQASYGSTGFVDFRDTISHGDSFCRVYANGTMNCYYG